MPLYSLFMPGQTVGAGAVHWDLFNATGSNANLEVIQVTPVVSGAVGVTGVVGVDIFFTRTSAVGTGGTAATRDGTSLTAATFTGVDTTIPLGALITARLTPTGGATAAGVLEWASLFTEETNSAAYNAYANMARTFPDAPGVWVSENQGVRVVQSSVASVGVVGYNILFRVFYKGGSQ